MKIKPQKNAYQSHPPLEVTAKPSLQLQGSRYRDAIGYGVAIALPEDKMTQLSAEPHEQYAKSRSLEAEIRKRLGGTGIDI